MCSSIFGVANPAFTITAPALTSLSLKGKAVLVAGGTNGIGRAVARLAAEKGEAVPPLIRLQCLHDLLQSFKLHW
jgi:hypothetical protein